MATTPSMPPFADDPTERPGQSMSQQTTPVNPFFDQSTLPPGPITRWQGPGQHWPPQPTQESPLVGGTLSPLSNFNPGWHQPSTSNRPWASPSQASTTFPIPQATSTAVYPHWSGTPLPGTHNPIDPAFTGYTQSAQSESTAHPWDWARQWNKDDPTPAGYTQSVQPENTAHPWDWARQWAKNNLRSSASSVTSSPDSRDSPGDRALTPFQTLSRHDSATTISSGYSKSSATLVPGSQHEPALATGRPPQQWRADFKMPRTGIAALVHRRKRSIAYPARHNPKAVLSPYLRYNGQDPPVYWDIQTSPSTVLFRDLRRPPRAGEFTRFVCEPPAPLMRIYHARVPWYVDVRATSNPVGVTFADLFEEIYKVMQIQIVDADFNNDELDDEERKRITAAYRNRVGSDRAEALKGIRRVDFLMGRFIFEGLVKGKEGLWEVKTTKPIQLSQP